MSKYHKVSMYIVYKKQTEKKETHISYSRNRDLVLIGKPRKLIRLTDGPFRVHWAKGRKIEYKKVRKFQLKILMMLKKLIQRRLL